MFKGSTKVWWYFTFLILIIAIACFIGFAIFVGGVILYFIKSLIKYLLNQNTENKDEALIQLIISIIGLVLVAILCAFIFQDEIKDRIDPTIWATQVVDIEDFDYYIDGNDIFIKKYLGNERKIKIADKYTINNIEYDVVALESNVFSSKNVKSLILPNSLITMKKDSLYCYSLKYIYIPSYIVVEKDKYSKKFYECFNDVEYIYFGGSEEQWNALIENADRADVDVKQIFYNSNQNMLTN